MTLYNLFIYFSTRAIIYLHYVNFAVALIILASILDGLGFRFLLENFPSWNNRSAFFVPVCNITTNIFTMAYLRMKENTLKLYKIMVLMTIILTIIGLSSFLFPYSIVMKIGTAAQSLNILYLITIACYSEFLRDRMALYFLPASLTLLIGIGMTSLKMGDIIPTTFVTTWGFKMGTALQAIFLSLGLGDKLNTM